jgi:phospholipid transport system substrate-binding protein
MIRAVVALLAATTVAFAQPATGGLGPGTTVVKTANDTIAKLLQQSAKASAQQQQALAAQIATAVGGVLDVDELGKRAMGAHWGKLTPTEQQAFLTLLNQLVQASYVAGLRANVQYQTTYQSESKNAAGNIVVKTVINTQNAKGKPVALQVDYELITKNGTLRAFDIVTSGVGLVANYQTMFNSVIAKKGFPGLLQAMQAKVAHLQTASPPTASATPAPTTPATTTAPAAGSATPAPSK